MESKHWLSSSVDFARLYFCRDFFYLRRHARIQKVLSEGSNFDKFFFSLMRGEWIQIRPLASHYRPVSEKPFFRIYSRNSTRYKTGEARLCGLVEPNYALYVHK